MAEHDQFYSFEQALTELRLREEELKRLVSEGEIRAFRDGDTMKLRRVDVDNLRAELSGGEVVDLGEGADELVFEDEMAGLGGDETGMATEEISDVDTILEEEIAADAGEFGDVDLAVEDVAVEEGEAEEEPAEDEAPVARATAPEVPEPYEGAGLRAALVVTTLILILAVPLILSADAESPSSLARSIASLFAFLG